VKTFIWVKLLSLSLSLSQMKELSNRNRRWEERGGGENESDFHSVEEGRGHGYNPVGGGVVENVDKMGRKASKNCWNTIWQKARKGDIFFYFSLKTNKLDSDLRDRLFLMKHSCNVAKKHFCQYRLLCFS
jgi:hypothetical protein